MITGYTVQCVSATGSPYNGETSNEQLTATGLSPNTIYNCSVYASNAQGNGPSAYQLVNTLEAREFTDHLYVSMYNLSRSITTAATHSSTDDNIDIAVVVGVVMPIVVVMIILCAAVVILLLTLKIRKIQSSH